jgi:hypothetical protein
VVNTDAETKLWPNRASERTTGIRPERSSSESTAPRRLATRSAGLLSKQRSAARTFALSCAGTSRLAPNVANTAKDCSPPNWVLPGPGVCLAHARSDKPSHSIHIGEQVLLDWLMCGSSVACFLRMRSRALTTLECRERPLHVVLARPRAIGDGGNKLRPCWANVRSQGSICADARSNSTPRQGRTRPEPTSSTSPDSGFTAECAQYGPSLPPYEF